MENPFPWKSAQISSQNQNHFQVNPQRNELLLHGTRMLGLGNCNGSLEFQIRNQCEDVCLIITNLHTSLGYITRSRICFTVGKMCQIRHCIQMFWKQKQRLLSNKIFQKCHFFIYESISGYSVAWTSWQQCGQMMDLKICQ